MVNFNANVKKIDINSIMYKLPEKEQLEIVFYFYTNSARRNSFYRFFTTFDETNITKNDLAIFYEVIHIFYVFDSARNIIYDMTSLQLFTFIDTHFDNKWLQMLNYASQRSYYLNYYVIIFVASMYGLLEYIDVYSVLRGELEDDFNRVLFEKECTIHKIDEITLYISTYKNMYRHNI